jgi:hypothetical protein
MKNIFLYLIFLICSQSYCQVKDSIRYISFPEKRKDFVVNKLTKKDTIYMIFEEKENQRKQFSRKKEKIVSYTYILDFEDNILGFSTGMEEYLSVDDMQKNKKAGVQWINKKFIRKNKDRIFTYKRIKKNGFYKTVEEISRATIYLIDIKMKENGKYKAREVGALFPIDI